MRLLLEVTIRSSAPSGPNRIVGISVGFATGY